ncbi:MAG: hypothetical protein Q9225_007174 [Loekoesia sp. 1 TL-2023]
MPFFSKKPSNGDVSPSETEGLTQDTEAMQRFTATGRPMPTYKSSSLANFTGDSSSQAPQFLPQKFTDGSIITIPIPLADLAEPSSPATTSSPSSSEPITERRRPSLFGKLAGKSSGEKQKEKKGGFKMVKMTRRKYLMYWAKDEEGRYFGTEPEGEGRRRLRERGKI